MKAITFVSILSLILAILLISSCYTAPKRMMPGEFLGVVWAGDYTEVKKLIEEGANVNDREENGTTALIYASKEGHTDIAKLLIDEGADVNAQEYHGWTALMFASIKGQIDIAKLLIEEGADLDARDDNGYTALMYAIANRNTDITMLLIEAGADVNVKDKWGLSAGTRKSREILKEADAK